MKNTIIKYILLAIILLSGVLVANGQTTSFKKNPTIGLHFFYNDFSGTRFGNLEGGFGVDYIHGLTNNIDLIGTFNGSWVDYLLPNNTLYGSSNFLLDINAGVHAKLLSDKHVFSPFLIAKASFTSYKSINGFGLTPGAGLQINMFKETFIITTIEYRVALSNGISNQYYYSIGIATSFGAKKIKPVKKIEVIPLPEPVKKEIVIPPKDFFITVVDEATGLPLPNAEIFVSGPEGKKFSGLTDINGKSVFYAMPPADYLVSGVLNNVNTSLQKIGKGNFETNDKAINITITHNDPRFTLAGVVINKTKNIPEGEAEINISNDTKHTITIKQSNLGDGIFESQLDPQSDFTIVGKKANYISNIEKVTTNGLNRSAILYINLELAIEEAKTGQRIVLNNIYFEVGKAVIKTDFSTDLDRLVLFLKDNPGAKLEIQGHTDSTGSLTLNNKLSQARADSVIEYLKKNGVESNRLTSKGYGPRVPIATNSTTEGKAKNRRVEMKVM